MHYRYTGNDQIHAANGVGMEISRIGKSIVPTPSCNLILNNVLHVPVARKNHISVHWFTLDNNTFIEFHPYFFLVKGRNTRKVLLHDPCKGGLHPLPFMKQLLSIIKLSVDRWHNHLDHPSREIVHRVICENKLPCTPYESSSESICDACLLAKAHQLPYPISTSRSTAPLELIFSDAWGLAIDSFRHKKYYVSFIDDYSKFI
jgi:hypothetical protein